LEFFLLSYFSTLWLQNYQAPITHVLDVLKAANRNIPGSFKNGKIMLKGDRYMLKSRVIKSLNPAVGMLQRGIVA